MNTFVASRRKVIALAAGAAAWPLAARAQQRARRIGVLMSVGENDSERQRRLKQFRDALQVLGWVEGRNVTYVYRWAQGSDERVRTYARELVAIAPDLLLTQSVELVTALHDETRTIPILFGSGSDPTEVGLVQSIAHPGGNVTGFMSIEAATNVKYLEFIKELDPRIRRVLVLMNSRDPSNEGRAQGIASGGPSLNVEVRKADVSNLSDLERAIDGFAAEPAGALVVVPNAVTSTHSRTIVEKAAQHRLPAVYPFSYFVEAGGLVAYGPDLGDQYIRAAGYADRILKGENAGDLPIQTPVKFELVINLKTAKALGLEVPPMLLARADGVIE